MKKQFIIIKIIFLLYFQFNALHAQDSNNHKDNGNAVSMRVVEGKYVKSSDTYEFKIEFKALGNSKVKYIYLSMYDFYHSRDKSAAIINVEFYHDEKPGFVCGGNLDPPQLNFTIDFTKSNPCIVQFNPPSIMFHFYSDVRKIRFELLATQPKNSELKVNNTFFTGSIYSNELLVSKKSVTLLPEKKSVIEVESLKKPENETRTIPATSVQDDIIYEKESKTPFTGKLVEYDSKGKRISEATYVNGIKNGSYINWDNNHKVLEMDYVNGTVDGFIKKFFPNGQMMWKRRYIDAKSTGEFYSWYENGEKKHQIKEINTQSKEDIWWDKNGDIIAHGIYNNNEHFSGTFLKEDIIETYQNGTLIKTSLYKNNLRDDPVNW